MQRQHETASGLNQRYDNAINRTIILLANDTLSLTNCQRIFPRMQFFVERCPPCFLRAIAPWKGNDGKVSQRSYYQFGSECWFERRFSYNLTINGVKDVSMGKATKSYRIGQLIRCRCLPFPPKRRQLSSAHLSKNVTSMEKQLVSKMSLSTVDSKEWLTTTHHPKIIISW